MPSDSLPLHVHELMRHREFVRRLAQSLLRDEAAAEDLAQDVLVAAWRKPPAQPGALRAFLARATRRRASNQRRASARRAWRESLAARADLDESDARARRDLELQQLVVGAVLALDEPYRGVLLATYYEGLNAQQIAQRRAQPAGTVRSQHSRALALLRERLDREHGGARDAWAGLLVSWLARVPPATSFANTASASPMLWPGALLALVAALAIAPFVWPRPRHAVPLAELSPSPAPSPGSNEAGAAGAPAALAPASTQEPRELAASPSQERPQELAAVDSVEELSDLATAAQGLLRERLLSVDAAASADFAWLAREPGAGVARILDRNAFGFEQANCVGIRGGGTYFSFTRNSHSDDRHPQLALADGHFGSGFAGSAEGWFLDLGERRLAAVALADAPPSLSGDELPSTAPADPNAPARRVPALLGHTYLLRARSLPDYDVLVAFCVLAADAHGQTIAWRTLRRWGPPDDRRLDFPELLNAGRAEAPAWMRALGTEELIELVRSIAKQLRERSLALEPDLVAQRGLPAGATDRGLVRMRERGSLNWLLPEGEDGSTYSFATRSHGYDGQPDLQLEEHAFDSGLYGGTVGCVLDLGRIELAELDSSGLRAPAGADAELEKRWRLLWDLERVRPTESDPQPRPLRAEDQQRVAELRLDRPAPVQPGHSYLLRAILPGEHDHLVAFEVLAADLGGCTLEWLVLKRW